MIEFLFGFAFLFLYHFVLKDQYSLAVSVSWLVYYTLLFIVLGVMSLYDKVHSYIPITFLSGYLVLTFIMFVMRIIDDPTIVTILSPIFVSLPFLLIWLVTKGRGHWG